MKTIRPKYVMAVLAAAGLLFTGSSALAQGRRGGLPNATPEQTQAVMDMATSLQEQSDAVTAARSDLAMVTFAETKDEAAIRQKVAALQAAELALANARAAAFAKLQADPTTKLTPEQVTALIAAGGTIQQGRGGGGGGRGGARGGAGGGGARGGGGGPAGAPARGN